MLNNEIHYFPKEIIKKSFILLFYLLLGMIICYPIKYLSLSAAGSFIIMFLLIIISLINRKLLLFLLFNILIFNDFYDNAKTELISNYLFNFLKIQSENIDIEGTPFGLTKFVLPIVIAFNFIYYFFKSKIKDKYIRYAIIVICFLTFYMFFQSIINSVSLLLCFSSVLKYVLFILTACLIIIIPINFKELKNYLIYIIFAYGFFQCIISIAGSASYIFSNLDYYSGDLIVGTTTTSTNYVYLLSFIIIFYIFTIKEWKLKNILFVLFLCFSLILAQSGLQTVILIIVIFMAFFIKDKTLFKYKFLIAAFFTAILFTFIIRYLPAILPTQTRQIEYALYTSEDVLKWGITYNNKVQTFDEIIYKSNKSNLFFGNGASRYRDKYVLDEYYTDINDSLVQTNDTFFLNVFYDYGIIGTIIVYFLFFVSIFYFLRKYLKTKSNEFLIIVSILLLLLFSSFLYRSTNNPFIAITSGTLIGLLYRYNILLNQNTENIILKNK